MAEASRFKRGDIVLHTRRPEWGEGVVTQANPIVHDGADAQRLVIKFANLGQVTINTGIAPLVPKESAGNGSGTRTVSADQPIASDHNSVWAGQAVSDQINDKAVLWKLPDVLTDPFSPGGRRLEATLESYRFTNDAHGLVDWAVAQTGLNDPLSKFTRSELEQGFERFVRDRDQHLRQLVRQLKSKGESQVVADVRRKVRLPAAMSALDRAINS